MKNLNKKLGELKNSIILDEIEKRKQIIKEINDIGYDELDMQKRKQLSNILSKIEQNIDTIDEKEKTILILELSNFTFSLEKIFIFIFIVIELYMILYAKAIIIGVFLGSIIILLYVFYKFVKNKIYKKINIKKDGDIFEAYNSNIKKVLEKNLVLFIIGLFFSILIYKTKAFIVLSFIPLIGLTVFIPLILVLYNGLIMIYYFKKYIFRNYDFKYILKNENLTQESIGRYNKQEYKKVKKIVIIILIIGLFSMPFIENILNFLK